MDHCVANPSNILVFRGVYARHIDSPVESRETVLSLVERMRGTSITSRPPLPRVFTGVDSWPKMTTLKCWTCDLIPTGFPRFIPQDPIIGGVPLGNFCDWPCAVDYIRCRLSKNKQWDAEKNVALVASLFAGRQIIKISASPLKTCMYEYCGDGGISPDDYRDLIAKLSQEYSLSSHRIDDFRGGGD